MEQVRNVRLDHLCEAIAEHRGALNEAKANEQGDIQASLAEMQRKGVTVYRHAGVELARVPGAEKLRVRLTKEEGDADAGDFEPSEDESQEEEIPLVAGEFAEERAEAVEDL
jgi:hypothetical protein